MTTVEKSHKNNNYYITLDITEKYGVYCYVVSVCPRINECMCGYPIKEMTYPLSEKVKADRSFKRYVKKYT